MMTVLSADGTRIAYEKSGSGPPLILVDGAFCHRGFGPMPKLAPMLAPHFTVLHYDRRGRGDSTDTPPYAVAREIEDLRALFGAVGEPAFLYGTSSGAMLALRATAAGLPVRKLVLHEPPLALDGTHHPQPPDLQARIGQALREDRHSDATALFMKSVGVPALVVSLMRMLPGPWPTILRTAHTLPNDFAILGDTQAGGPVPDELRAVMAAVNVPARLLVGSKSPPWMHHAVKVVAQGVRAPEPTVLPRQDHNVAAPAVAPVLRSFFLG